jgi:V/A-type H+-transporting ATPase subunit K
VHFLAAAVALPTDANGAQVVGNALIYIPIGAGLAVGLTGIGAGIAIKTVGTAAIATLTENEGAFFKAFLIVALGEALAIYGFIIAFLLYSLIPTLTA